MFRGYFGSSSNYSLQDFLPPTSIDQDMYLRRFCQCFRQLTFAIGDLNLTSGVRSGCPELRQDVEIVVLTKHEPRVFLGVSRPHGLRQHHHGLASLSMLNNPNRVRIFPVASNQVLAGRHGFIADGEMKRDINYRLAIGLCKDG